MRARATILVVAAIGAVIMLTSCGDSDDATSQSAEDGSGAQASETASANGGSSGESESADQPVEVEAVNTSPLKKAAYLEKVNLACGKEGEQTAQEVEPFAREVVKAEEPPEPVLLARILKEVLLPSYEEELEAISELGAPAGDEKKIEAMLTAQGEAIEKSKQLEQVKLPEEFENYFEKVSRDLEAYGFTSCVHG